jgi:hypothetical protein
MKKIIPFFVVLICLCLFSENLHGQQRKRRIRLSNTLRFSNFDNKMDTSEKEYIKNGFAYGGLHFTNHINALGRDNNIQQWGLSPILGFQKNNLDIYTNGFRWSKTQPKWAETDIGISKNWFADAPLNIITTYEHALIHYGTDDDKYALNNLFSTQINWNNRYFDFDTRYEYDWGRNKAAILEFSLGREFNFYNISSNAKLEFTPRFYLTYLGNPSRFQIANYEIALPITWSKIGKIDYNFSLNYAIPKNVLPEEGTSKSLFYFSCSVVKTLKFKGKNA